MTLWELVSDDIARLERQIRLGGTLPLSTIKSQLHTLENIERNVLALKDADEALTGAVVKMVSDMNQILGPDHQRAIMHGLGREYEES